MSERGKGVEDLSKSKREQQRRTRKRRVGEWDKLKKEVWGFMTWEKGETRRIVQNGGKSFQ